MNSTKAAPPALVPIDRTSNVLTTDVAAGTLSRVVTREGLPAAPAPAKAPAPIQPLDLADVNKLVSETDTVLAGRNAARLPAALAFGQGVGQVGIEPTEFLAQKKRYLDFLAQIRRENEGDDTADSPGYSLNLMRIPVSVLPGKRTDVGFGAEITMTATPVLGDDLLPTTFRNLIQNDLVNQLGFPLTQVFNNGDYDDLLNPETKHLIEGLSLIRKWARVPIDPKTLGAQVASLGGSDKRRLWVALKAVVVGGEQLPEPTPTAVDGALVEALDAVLRHYADLDRRRGQRMGCDSPTPLPVPGPLVPAAMTQQPAPGTVPPPKGETYYVRPNVSLSSPLMSTIPLPRGPGADRSKGGRVVGGQPKATPAGVKQVTVRDVASAVFQQGLSFANGLDNRVAFPTSQLFDVYGDANLFAIGYGASEALGASIEAQGYAHLPDVQSYLREEARAAYQFLAQPQQQCLWDEFCTPELVTAVRTRQVARLQDLREEFRCRVEALTLTDQYRLSRPANELMQFSTTAALAWCIVVDSALLTDRLVRDMRETATAKGLSLPGCDRWCPYYLPDPPPECRQAFNEYVKVRWPIHVFALDPYVQEQNIADSLSTRREMQLALAIAFTNGQISARNMTKYVRRLEAEYQTIALNRTQVGFSHGENVFGWRFYPRFQSPDTKSNLEVLFREQLIGGPNRNQLLRDRRLEPGMRECVAVVMMPSFVPYVTVDTSSNWFPLPNPKHKVLDTTDAVKLSRAVQTIKTCAGGVGDAACYREGEFPRLLRKAEQLEARLPLQTLTSPVPILNTYGGFEMFSNGTSDLAPELFGWYGAPGIDPAAETTTLFLVGDHFSPLRTRVIVGNQAVDSTDTKAQALLSRQVMQVTFRKGAYPVTDEKGAASTVRVHVATPYGVTRELDIPVVKQVPKADPTPGFSFGGAKLTVNYGMAGTVGQDKKPTGYFSPIPQGADGELTIGWVAPGNTLTPQVEVAFEFTYQTATLKVPCTVAVVGDVKAKSVVISKAEAGRLANELVGQIAAVSPVLPCGDQNPLGKGLTSTKVTIRPLAAPPLVAQAVETNDQLRVEFKATGICPQPVPHTPGPVPLPAPQPLVPNPVPVPATQPANPVPGAR